jgi:hypothetical protein
VPWCDECAKFWNPPSLRDGACPTCGAVLERPATPPTDRAPGTDEDEEQLKAPWHFKLLLVALVLYLGYRAYQGVFWLAHHL